MTQMLRLEAWYNPMSWESVPFACVVAALWVIVMARSNATYWVGRAIASGTERTRWKRWLETKHYDSAHRWINRWGASAVTLSYLTVGIQTMVHLAAGAMRMSLIRYVPATMVGSVLWGLLYGSIGFIGWKAVTRLWAFSPMLVWLAAAVIVVTLAVFLLLGRSERRAEKMAE